MTLFLHSKAALVIPRSKTLALSAGKNTRDFGIFTIKVVQFADVHPKIEILKIDRVDLKEWDKQVFGQPECRRLAESFLSLRSWTVLR